MAKSFMAVSRYLLRYLIHPILFVRAAGGGRWSRDVAPPLIRSAPPTTFSRFAREGNARPFSREAGEGVMRSMTDEGRREPLPCESLRIAGVDIQYIARRFGRQVAGEEIDTLGDILRQHRQLQQRALAIDFLELVLRDLVGGGALLAPFAGPDFRAAQDGVGIDGVDPDAMRGAFQREAAREVDFRRFGGAISRGAGRGGEAVLGGDEDDRAAAFLALHQPERFARDQEIAGRQHVHVLLPERQ